MKKTFWIILILTATVLFGDTTIVAFDEVHQSFGGGINNRSVIDSIQFPVTNAGFGQILMHFQLDCPTGGCDPWDRKASISVEHLGSWYEIGRYVTPYGIECGWTLDVTPYRSLLEGEVQLRSFIDTWVNPAWLVTIVFEFISGTPEYPYTVIRNLWNYDYIIYGDTTSQIIIPSITEYIPSDAQTAFLRMITTGHGQGNTDNAAEFSQKFHDIYMNGELAFVHDFWRDDCEYNSCSPQNGTWQYDRAGFCPGDKVDPQDFNLSDIVISGDTTTLGYVLEDYFNECSPNNPFCINGVTCANCNYNNTGHTEPNYFIASQLIINTQSYHSNADAFLSLSGSNLSNGIIEILLENYVPIYGLQFNFDLSGLTGINTNELIFDNGVGGRAEESGWIVSVNDSGIVIALSQNTGAPLPAGEGILTQIYWNGSELPEISGTLSIKDVSVSGYFGSELSYEVGPALNIESSMATNGQTQLPFRHSLLPAYPNPFNPSTIIHYYIAYSEKINLVIYDLNGKKVHTLINQLEMQPGKHQILWNASEFGSGLYFIQLITGKQINTQKIMLVK